MLLTALLLAMASDELVVRIAKDGSCVVEDKTLVEAKEAFATKKLADLLEARRQDKRFQLKEGDASRVNYMLVLDAEPGTAWVHVMKVVLVAATCGGSPRIGFAEWGRRGRVKQEAGARGGVLAETVEARVVLCAVGDEAEHARNRAAHEDTKADPCTAYVDRQEAGRLSLDAKKAEEDRRTIAAIVVKVKGLRPAKADVDFIVVLDIDDQVPAAHVLRVMEALGAEKIVSVEFTVPKRLEK